MSGKVKWGILGGGIIANDFIAPAIQHSKNAELVAVYSRSREKAEIFAKRHQIPYYYDNKEGFFRNETIEVVYISTPNSHHHIDVIKAAKKSKHIFCEKPMATNLEDALLMKQECLSNEVKFGLAFMFPFHPLSKLAKEWIIRGRIGEIQLVSANFIFDLPECEKVNPWRFQPELSGGGAVIEVGCHCVNILNYLIGKKIVSISAMMNRDRWQAPSESIGIISFQYENQIMGQITVANNISGAGPYGMNFMIHGKEGSIIGLGNMNRYPSGTLIFRNRLGHEEIVSLPLSSRLDLYIEEIERFSDVILNQSLPYVGLEDGIYNLKIILAAYESASLGHAVQIK